MKALSLISLAALVLLAGCGQSGDSIKEFIPGTYVRASENEFGKKYDTLVISLQNETAAQYWILRKWRYDRVLDGTSVRAGI
jgi:major membrane immunogen (membrane-anchored lipoprotein)